MAEPGDRPTTRTRLESADLAAAWEQNASDFIAFARESDEHFRTYHRDLFLELLPPPGTRTLDLGCGEGRLSRHLKSLGHDVVGVDASPTMLAAAHDADPDLETHLADVAALPLAASTFDLVIAFMSLQDVENLDGAVAEASRVLGPGGRFCLAVVHPLASAGEFASTEVDSPFTITGSYLQPSYYADQIARDGRELTLVSAHRPMQAYADALTGAGFVIERLREIGRPDHAITYERNRRWQRLPLFLHLRAVKR
jgi:SAM-dependent methyltransferase